MSGDQWEEEMTKIMMAVVLAFALAASSCGGGSLIGASLSPTDGAIDQLPNVPVTATFSANIDDSTLNILMGLFKNGEQPSLCTSFSYNSSSHVATCNHELLELGTSYTIAIAPFRNIRPGTASFTTIAIPAAQVEDGEEKGEGADETNLDPEGESEEYGEGEAEDISPEETEESDEADLEEER